MATGHMSGTPRRKAAPPADGVPTGLCKYTDVAFQWRRLLGRNAPWAGKDGDMEALRAALDTRLWLPAREGDPCLSPLWQTHGELGQAGIEMWVGHSSDTRMVLCLSLDSVNRMAETLYAQEKTSRVLALPAALVLSEKQCDELVRMERYVVATLAEMRSLQKTVDKHNKHVQNEENMSQWGGEYEEVRRVWRSSERPTFIGFDVETYEVDHSHILEVGWSVVGPDREQETVHCLMEEAYSDGLRNGRYVPDNRRRFLFGTAVDTPRLGRLPDWKPNGTEVVWQSDAGKHFTKVLRAHQRSGPVYVVFHDSKGDMNVMDELGIDTKHWSYSLWGNESAEKGATKRAGTMPVSGEPLVSSLLADDDEGDDKGLHPVYVLDTQLLFAATRCGGSGQKRSLKSICIALDVNGGKLDCLHNAANDAHYTAAALASMAAGPHFIAMRGVAEERLAAEEARSKKAETARKKTARKVKSWE